MLGILEKLGSSIKWVNKRTIQIENKNISPDNLNGDAVKKMRASILFLGPLLARFGKVEKMQYPGGCSIGPRPIDTHLAAFSDLGAKVILGKKFFSVFFPSENRVPPEVVLNEFSVTATENILAFLSSIPQKIQIKIAAAEPHVADLAKFISKMGAKVSGAGTSVISISGSERLTGASHKITPDYIEAGTFILASLASPKSGEAIRANSVTIKNAPISHLDLFIKKLISGGADIKIDKTKNTLKVTGGKRMTIAKIQTMPYPGIPSDLQSSFGVLATQTAGNTLVHETLYEGRLSYLRELNKMGAKIKILDPHRAIIGGPVKLRGAEVLASDLRGGAALVIAGLIARGTTVVIGAEHIERGYEDLDGRLRKLGADIKKI
jgi:UDP-N-acetylglucosamine 1-carboxyvinyltransferase